MKRRLKKYVDEMPVKSKDEMMEQLGVPGAPDSRKRVRNTRAWRNAGISIGVAAAAGAIVIPTVIFSGNNANDYSAVSSEYNLALVDTTSASVSAPATPGIKPAAPPSPEMPALTPEFAGDGEIAGERNGINDEAKGGYAYSDDMELATPALEGDVASEKTAIPDYAELGYDYEIYEPAPGIEAVAGTLTGGTISDITEFAKWLNDADAEMLKSWGIFSGRRIVVDAGAPGVRVVLNDNSQNTLFEAVTDYSGRAYLYDGFKAEGGFEGSVTIGSAISVPVSWSPEGYGFSDTENASCSANDIELTIKCGAEGVSYKKLDLMYVVDTTGSMGDELDYLKAEIADVISRARAESGMEIRTSVNFYRDTEDEYVVRYFDFRENEKEVMDIVKEQYAAGGGDFPEAVEQALNNALEHDWDMSPDTVRLMFLVLDAPPHEDPAIQAQIADAVKRAAAAGIRIIPVSSSNSDEMTQQLTRAMALATGGQFIFLDDNSGISVGSHIIPVEPSEYTSEALNEMMIRLICEYCGGTKPVVPAPTQPETEPVTEPETTTEYHQ